MGRLSRAKAEAEELSGELARLPGLSESLRNATPEVRRQVFEAFDLEVLSGKAERKIEISATIPRPSRMPSGSRKPSQRRARWWY